MFTYQWKAQLGARLSGSSVHSIYKVLDLITSITKRKESSFGHYAELILFSLSFGLFWRRSTVIVLGHPKILMA
jgi:hypothetical protein